MNLKKYAYDMWTLSQEDQRRGNPSGVEMGFDLFRKGCLTGTEPLEGFDSGIDWAQAQAGWVEGMATQTQREESSGELRAPEGAYENFQVGVLYLTDEGWRCDGTGTGP